MACACHASRGGGGLLTEEKRRGHKPAPFLVACTIVTVYCVEADVGLPVYAKAAFDVRRGSHACRRQSALMWKQRCSRTGVAGTTIPQKFLDQMVAVTWHVPVENGISTTVSGRKTGG